MSDLSPSAELQQTPPGYTQHTRHTRHTRRTRHERENVEPRVEERMTAAQLDEEMVQTLEALEAYYVGRDPSVSDISEDDDGSGIEEVIQAWVDCGWLYTPSTEEMEEEIKTYEAWNTD